MHPSQYIGIDLGGTRIKGIFLGKNLEISKPIIWPTNDIEGNWKAVILEAVKSLSFDNKEVVVGISAPGLPNKENSSIAYMPGRLAGLENFDWSQYLQKPCYVLNDGIAALMAETKIGAAQNSQNAVMLTLGTGVGGGLLINGKPYQGSFQKAGHMGHSVVDCNADDDVTGMPGSIEECIGNCTILKRSSGRFSSTQQLLDAHKNGDEFASAVWLKSVKHLAISLASISNIISPDTIIIGGGIAEANDLLFVPLRQLVDKYEWQPGGYKASIVKAQQGDLAGAIGAAFFAKEKYENNG